MQLTIHESILTFKWSETLVMQAQTVAQMATTTYYYYSYSYTPTASPPTPIPTPTTQLY